VIACGRERIGSPPRFELLLACYLVHQLATLCTSLLTPCLAHFTRLPFLFREVSISTAVLV
jgi:hypothetical protein